MTEGLMTKNGAYHVERDVPIPARKRGGGRKGVSKYPYRTMLAGEMFFVPINGATYQTVRNVLYVAQRHAAPDLNGAEFTYRRITHSGVDGVGCWRVK